ncbi:NADAR family protein [Acinetobacter gerneri]|uniref:NADAR family protein n=1 Tax=Acinetobacter gerneri TaxID=202952 RepID=A0AAW8JJB4_9GAMM|nr:NADAR family protein [Acinetobacter gerneri]MDQ9009358.1 NADAR family protein [Acinetobacter gerneri]MDQ9013440.1 NADAR family protein [Acinetobacter gerneri]MDQ9024722.1 NADAR family protein [Acinetobacter gerneri]MDQ9052112.1 NADAR family protein [Acinetobacter gerneri]MDQ9059533.1 NADAR family protein [Acinetobacter gerneri]
MSDLKYLENLQEMVKHGQHFKYLFFWGHTPKQENAADKSCLSQWYPSAFNVDGIDYPTAEHYMMAQKAKLFQDHEIFQQIVSVKTPGEVKALGRKVKNYDEEIWQAHRFNIVVEGNRAKFSQNSGLKQFLQSTQNRILVEASPVDNIWGIGLAEDHLDATNPESWQGLNLLGFALMEARQQLSD